MTFDLIDTDGESRFSEPLGFPEWMGRGNCASNGSRIDDFMSEETSEGEQIDSITGKVLGAKWVCVGCPVRATCLKWALTFEEVYGFRSGTFGGLCPSERVFAAQANDPIAFGIKLLDEQVSMGLVVPRTDRYGERDGLSRTV